MDIEAAQHVALASALPGRELGRNEKNRSSGSYLGARTEDDGRRLRDRFVVPGVGEAENVGVGWHDVEDQRGFRTSPAAKNRLVARLLESSLPQAIPEPVITHPRGTSQTTSTSSVARTGGEAGSVIQRWIVAPPTKTTSSRSGPSTVATASN
jgi:hypothetical protein